MEPAPAPPPDASRAAPVARPTYRRSPGRDLPMAIAVGLTLAAVFLGTLFLNAWAFLTFVAILVVIAQLELDSAFRAQGLRPATPVAVGAGLVTIYGAHGLGEAGQSLGLVVLVIGTMLVTLLDGGRRQVAASLGAAFLMTLWVPFLASYAALLLARPDGIWFVMAAIALTVSNDIGAYAFGFKFGRHSLAPSVSPAKTWEGFAGGLATVLLIAAFVTAEVVPGLGRGQALVLGAGIAVAATLGDLAESLVKRDLGVKDLGRILPGHGGVMDRVDAMLFTLPVAHLLLLALGT